MGAGCWTVRGPLWHQASPGAQRAGVGVGQEEWGLDLKLCSLAIERCPLKRPRMTSGWRAAATNPVHFIPRRARPSPRITVRHRRAHLRSGGTEENTPRAARSDNQLRKMSTHSITHSSSLWESSWGLSCNPLTREPVCIACTPNKMAAGSQPWASGRKAVVGTACHLQSL